MDLPATVRARIERDFPTEYHGKVEALLTTYGTETFHKEQERVLLDILALAKGDLQQVEELVERARTDYRDIIFWAEYPAESRLDTKGKIESMNKMLCKFGVKWRIKKKGSAKSRLGVMPYKVRRSGRCWKGILSVWGRKEKRNRSSYQDRRELIRRGC